MDAEHTLGSPRQEDTPSKDSGPTSVQNEEEYDPYKYRTEGHIGTVVAFFHLVKSSIGSGVLSMPAGFKAAGMAGGLISATVLPALVIMCFLILVNTMVRIAAEEKVPYINLQDSAMWSMEHSHKTFARYAKTLGLIIDIMFLITYFGVCAAYYNYVVVVTLTVMGDDYAHHAEGAINLPRVLIGLAWIIPFFAVNCFRNMKALAPTSMAGNVMICSALLIVIIIILWPEESGKVVFSNDWQYFSTWSETPLFFGVMIFSVGAVGVSIAVEKDMKNARRFCGWAGVYNLAMCVSVVFYVIIAFLGYYKYGACTRTTIVLNMPKGSWYATAVQVTVGIALFFSFPLMCFIIFEVLWWGQIAPKIEARRLMWEYIFRFGVTIFIGVIGLLVPRLDLVLGFVGSFSLGFLSVFLPGFLEYNYTYGKHGWDKATRTLVKDIFIMVFGIFAVASGTYSAIYGIIVSSQPMDEMKPGTNCSR